MERRVLIAIFLSFLVLYGYQAFIVKPEPKPAPGTPAAQTAKTSTPAAAAPSGSAARAVAAPAPSAAALVGDSAERDVRVETRDVIAVITNRGARLKSWRLKRYLDQRSSTRRSTAPSTRSMPRHPK